MRTPGNLIINGIEYTPVKKEPRKFTIFCDHSQTDGWGLTQRHYIVLTHVGERPIVFGEKVEVIEVLSEC